MDKNIWVPGVERGFALGIYCIQQKIIILLLKPMVNNCIGTNNNFE